MSIIKAAGAGEVSTGFFDYELNQSLRFNDGDDPYLTFTPSSATNQKTWTYSLWVKRTTLGARQCLLAAGTGGGLVMEFRFGNSDQLEYLDSSSTYLFITSQKFRDPAAWYHLVLRVDTTESSVNARTRLYVNGEQITSFSTDNRSNHTLNEDLAVNTTTVHYISRWVTGGENHDGYLAEINFLDGVSVDCNSFGEFKDGVWVPKEYSGSYGTNGWHLDFADSSDIGNNANTTDGTNDWTPSGLAATDVVPDSPTNNWCTNNAAMRGNFTHSEGNLKLVGVGNNFDNMAGTFMFDVEDSDGWYWEVYINSGSTEIRVGISKPQNIYFNQSDPTYNYSHSSDGISYRAGGGEKGTSGTSSSYGDSFTTGDVIGIAVKAGAIYFYKNGTIQNSGTAAFTGLTGQYVPAFSINSTYSLTANYGQDSTFAGAISSGGNSDKNGIGDFKYSVPSGYKALCASSLPDITIGPGQDTQSDDHFDTLLWTGNGSNAGDQQEIDGLSFTPDFVWTKGRGGDGSNPASGQQYHELHDSVRGAGKRVFTNTADAESDVQTIKSFDSDGFTVAMGTGGQSGTNQITTTMVGWCWKAGTAFSNDSSATGVGTLDSTGSVNQAAGFSIISYTGTIQSGETVAHGLGGVPEMIWAKNRDSSANWVVFTKDLSSAHTLYFNNTIGQNSSATTWGNHTSTVFGVDDDPQSNPNGDATIAYLFRSIEGYSKVGKYTGNGNADGTFVYTGFRPAWVMIKNITNSGTNFLLFDNKRSTFNVTNDALLAGSNAAEYVDNSSFAIDMLSNGFKPRSSYGDSNQSGSTMIYLAMAEAPFKFANSR